MSVLSAAQIAVIAKAHGFSNTDHGQHDHALTWIVAIALAESRGNTEATNLNDDGSIDRGLTQVNSCHVPPYDAQSLFDADYNMDAAWDISSHGHDFTPWATYNSGAAAEEYSNAAEGVAGMRNAAPVTVGGDVTTGIHKPAGGGSLYYQTVVWTHERPTVTITSGDTTPRFH